MTDSLLKYEFSKDKNSISLDTGEETKTFDTLHVAKFSSTTILESLVSDNHDAYTKRELKILYNDLDTLKHSNEFKDVVKELNQKEINSKNEIKLSYELSDNKTLITLNTGMVGASKVFLIEDLLKYPINETLDKLTFEENDIWKPYDFSKKEKDILFNELEKFVFSDEFKEILNDSKLIILEHKMSIMINEALKEGVTIPEIGNKFNQTLLKEQEKMIENNKFFKNEKGFEMNTPW